MTEKERVADMGAAIEERMIQILMRRFRLTAVRENFVYDPAIARQCAVELLACESVRSDMLAAVMAEVVG